jgi:hypothetical protein
MRIEIAVVDHENERWFEFGGLKFDALGALWEFEGDPVLLIRNGQEAGQSELRESRGEPCFRSYNGSQELEGSSLSALNFQEGDRLVLGVPEGFDLALNLRNYASFMGAFLATVPVGEKLSLGEVGKRVRPEMERNGPEFANCSVIRFSRNA